MAVALSEHQKCEPRVGSQARCKVCRHVVALGHSSIGVRVVSSTDEPLLQEVERVQTEHVGRVCTPTLMRCTRHTSAQREQLRARLHHQMCTLERLSLCAGCVHTLQLCARQPTPAGRNELKNRRTRE